MGVALERDYSREFTSFGLLSPENIYKKGQLYEKLLSSLYLDSGTYHDERPITTQRNICHVFLNICSSLLYRGLIANKMSPRLAPFCMQVNVYLGSAKLRHAGVTVEALRKINVIQRLSWVRLM